MLFSSSYIQQIMKQQEMVKIPMHSLIDLITNSSTEIFVHSEKSLQACKDLINEFLKTLNSELTCDDIFELSVEPEKYTIDNYKERIEWEFEDEDYEQKIQMVDQYLAGDIEKPDWWEDYHLETFLILKPKDKKYKKLAELFKQFLYSGDYFEHSSD